MKISIIIPAHNEEGLLAKTIESALAQDYHDFEVIVVNNASTDNTENIAKKYPVVLVNELRPGSQLAREAGRRVARGELIANIDADCLPPSDWLRRGVGVFREDPLVVALTGPYDYYDSGRIFRKVSYSFQKYIYRHLNSFLSRGGKRGILIGGNILLRAKALEAAGGYNTSILFYGDDTDTAKRLASQGKIVFDKDFVMPSSARRFKSQGVARTMTLYIFHFFRVAFFNE